MQNSELQIFSILPVVIIMLSTIAKHRQYSPATKAFLIQCSAIIFMLIIDAMAYIFFDMDTEFAIKAGLVINFLYFLFLIVMVSPWLSYLDLLIFNDVKRLKKPFSTCSLLLSDLS